MTEEEATKHYERMAAFRLKFDPTGGAILSAVDVGTSAHWWDYGRLGLYFENNLLLAEKSASAFALRTFLGIQQSRQQESKLGGDTKLNEESVVLGCKIGGGSIGKGNVLVNVCAPSIDVEDCILVNVTSSVPIVGKGGLLYNVVNDAAEGSLECNKVRVDVFMPDKTLTMNSARDIDGGKVWKQQLDINPASYETVYKTNQKLDVSECTALAKTAHTT